MIFSKLKPFIYTILLAVLSHVGKADDPTGITFFKGSWREVLAEAKRKNKPIFVDVFTTWCVPCKRMALQAFPDAKVGDKFNTHFINYQIDAEKGEGVMVAQKYAVNAYPTSLYVSVNGDLFHRSTGYSGIKGLLDEADKAIIAAEDPNPLSRLEKEFAAGKKDPEFLATYLEKRAAIQMPNEKALTIYLKGIPEDEWKSDTNLALLAGNTTTYNTKIVELLLQKLGELKGATNEQTITFRNKLSEGVYRLNQEHKKQALFLKNERMIDEVIKTNEAYLNTVGRLPLSPEQAADIAISYRMDFYRKIKNLPKYLALIAEQATKLMQFTSVDLARRNEEAFQRFEAETSSIADSIKQTEEFKKYAAKMAHTEPAQTAIKLNNMARAYYEHATDKKALHQALIWSGKSLEYNRSSSNLATYAHLLKKIGRNSEAINAQQEAIAVEKATGGDPTEYEIELAAMKKR